MQPNQFAKMIVFFLAVAFGITGCATDTQDRAGYRAQYDERFCPKPIIMATSVATYGETPVIPEATVYFDTDKYNIKPRYHAELDAVAAALKKYPDLKMSVAGHTDIVWTPVYNVDLSKNRAMAVKNYLLQKGARADQLIISFHGLTRPAAPNNTAAGRAKNRRTEVRPIR